MITITIEETDKDGRVLGRHVASAPIDKNDAKGVGSLLARSVGGLMYHGQTRAEVPLLIAAAGTHRSSRCTQAIAYALGLAGNEHSFEYAVKPVVDLDHLLDYRASKKDREHAAQMLKIMGAGVKTKGEAVTLATGGKIAYETADAAARASARAHPAAATEGGGA